MASDETILEAGPSPFYDSEKMVDGAESKAYYLPLVQFPYRQLPSRIPSKTPAYDLMFKQGSMIFEKNSFLSLAASFVFP